jgi:Condensation domain
VVAILMHHLLSDGRSQLLYARRLAAAISGTVEPQAESAYHDAVRAVRAAENRARCHDLDYWIDRISTGLPATPWEGAGGSSGQVGTNVMLADLGGALPRLCSLAERACCSLFVVLTAAVHRALAGQGMACSVACATASVRPPGGFGEVSGCFINQVALVSDNRAATSLADLVERQAPGWQADLRRRDLPYLDLLRALRARPGRTPRLDAVMISYRRGPIVDTWSDGGPTFRVDHFHRYRDSKTDLSFRYFHDGSRLKCNVEWSQDVPTRVGEQIAAMLQATLESG